MQTEELLTAVYGKLHELLGDHREFKRETLSRLEALEGELKAAPGARIAKACALVSAVSGLASILGGLGIRLVASVVAGGAQGVAV